MSSILSSLLSSSLPSLLAYFLSSVPSVPIASHLSRSFRPWNSVFRRFVDRERFKVMVRVFTNISLFTHLLSIIYLLSVSLFILLSHTFSFRSLVHNFLSYNVSPSLSLVSICLSPISLSLISLCFSPPPPSSLATVCYSGISNNNKNWCSTWIENDM